MKSIQTHILKSGPLLLENRFIYFLHQRCLLIRAPTSDIAVLLKLRKTEKQWKQMLINSDNEGTVVFYNNKVKK